MKKETKMENEVIFDLSAILDDLDLASDVLNTCVIALEECEAQQEPVRTLNFILEPMLERVRLEIEDIICAEAENNDEKLARAKIPTWTHRNVKHEL